MKEASDDDVGMDKKRKKKSSPTNKLDTIILSPGAIVSVIAPTTVLHESNPTHTHKVKALRLICMGQRVRCDDSLSLRVMTHE